MKIVVYPSTQSGLIRQSGRGVGRLVGKCGEKGRGGAMAYLWTQNAAILKTPKSGAKSLMMSSVLVARVDDHFTSSTPGGKTCNSLIPPTKRVAENGVEGYWAKLDEFEYFLHFEIAACKISWNGVFYLYVWNPPSLPVGSGLTSCTTTLEGRHPAPDACVGQRISGVRLRVGEALPAQRRRFLLPTQR